MFKVSFCLPPTWGTSHAVLIHGSNVAKLAFVEGQALRSGAGGKPRTHRAPACVRSSAALSLRAASPGSSPSPV